MSKKKQVVIAKMTGFKATDKDMCCRGMQFELGKWYEVKGDLVECGNGFHFCEQPSGVWAYYSAPGSRLFRVEAEDVLDTPFQPGTDYKRVARRIRFIDEITIAGHWNTGDRNTGHWNTGHWNTGHRNTGHWNTGHRNTGDRNTGDRNTGHWNTGHWNTGDRNTGHWNTGDWNTGHWNTTDFSAGFFCQEKQTVRCFDVETGLTRDELFEKYPEMRRLGSLLSDTTPIDFEDFKDVPGITKAKLKSLHKKYLAARK